MNQKMKSEFLKKILCKPLVGKQSLGQSSHDSSTFNEILYSSPYQNKEGEEMQMCIVLINKAVEVDRPTLCQQEKLFQLQSSIRKFCLKLFLKHKTNCTAKTLYNAYLRRIPCKLDKQLPEHCLVSQQGAGIHSTARPFNEKRKQKQNKLRIKSFPACDSARRSRF